MSFSALSSVARTGTKSSTFQSRRFLAQVAATTPRASSYKVVVVGTKDPLQGGVPNPPDLFFLLLFSR